MDKLRGTFHPVAPDFDASHYTALLMNRRDVDPISGCWRWKGSHSDDGYGRIRIGGVLVSVVRLAAAIFLGFELGKPCKVKHIRACKHRDCFLPQHIRIPAIKKVVYPSEEPLGKEIAS